METGGSWDLDYTDVIMGTEAGLHLQSHHVLFGAAGEEEDDDKVLMLSDDDLSWSGELLLSSRRPPQLPQQQQLDLDDDDDVAWDQLELDPDPTPAASQSPSREGGGCGGAEDNDGPSISSASSYASTTTTPSPPAAPQQCRHDPDEHSRWLRETNAFLQEAMVYLVGSIALKTQKDERRALQCFRKAHELGHARGTFRVGLAHLEGTGGVEKGEELAKAYLRESLDQFVSHQIQDSDYYGNFRQYLENDFRHGALRHPLVLDLLQLYAEQSEDIKKVVDFALERNIARRRNITIAGNLPIFGTAAATCGTPPASHNVSRDPTECCRPEATQPAEDEAAAATTTTQQQQQQQQTDEEGTENGRGRGKKSKKEKKEKKEKVKKEKRAKEKETRRERKKSSGTDKKTDRELKKERKRLEREDKEREKERRREEKKARRSEKDAARRTKEDERRALKRQPSKKKINAEAAPGLPWSSA